MPPFRARLKTVPFGLDYPVLHEDPDFDLDAHLWEMAHAAAGLDAPPLPDSGFDHPAPRLSEQWYCCAEPTSQQLAGF